jgi:hypothetical protein
VSTQKKSHCKKCTLLWPLTVYRSTQSELRITNNQTRRTWPTNILPFRMTSASSMEAPVSLSRIVVLPAFARPKIRIRNFKYGLFENDKSPWSEISSLEDVSPVSEAIEGKTTEGGNQRSLINVGVPTFNGASHGYLARFFATTD